MEQRQFMQSLYKRLNGDREKVVEAYAKAEELGEVPRRSNTRDISSREYASRLFSDGIFKGWLKEN